MLVVHLLGGTFTRLVWCFIWRYTSLFLCEKITLSAAGSFFFFFFLCYFTCATFEVGVLAFFLAY